MLQPVYTKHFKKDIEKLKTVIRLLLDENKLNPFYRDYLLKGNYKDRRELHIEPDWLLIYKINKAEKVMLFERTGSHAELFE